MNERVRKMLIENYNLESLRVIEKPEIDEKKGKVHSLLLVIRGLERGRHGVIWQNNDSRWTLTIDTNYGKAGDIMRYELDSDMNEESRDQLCIR